MRDNLGLNRFFAQSFGAIPFWCGRAAQFVECLGEDRDALEVEGVGIEHPPLRCLCIRLGRLGCFAEWLLRKKSATKWEKWLQRHEAAYIRRLIGW